MALVSPPLVPRVPTSTGLRGEGRGAAQQIGGQKRPDRVPPDMQAAGAKPPARGAAPAAKGQGASAAPPQRTPSLAETVAGIAAQAGLPPLSNEVAVSLAPNVEYHLREVIQEAAKFMRHSKRSTLATRDINLALRSMGIEQLFGYFSAEPLRFQKVAGSSGGLYAVHDPVLQLDEVIKEPLPACPLEPTMAAHWMAIEGVQPAIPQNPAPPSADAAPPASAGASEAGAATSGGAAGAAGTSVDRGGEAAGEAAAPVKVVPVVKNVLSRELQLYYDSVTDAIMNGTEAQRSASLSSVAKDAGLHLLIPYLTLFVSDQVTHSLRDLDKLRSLMATVKALLTNPHICIEPYVHQLIPAVLTCVVGKRLCAEPTEDHWKLREEAADIVVDICTTFGAAYETLQPRVTKTLLGAFVNPARPLTTHYGAIVGLTKLGPHTIHNLVLPHLQAYMTRLEPERLSATDSVKRLEASKCYSALLTCAGLYVKRYWNLFDPSPSGSARPGAPTAAGKGGTKRVASVMSQYAVPSAKRGKAAGDGDSGAAAAEPPTETDARQPAAAEASTASAGVGAGTATAGAAAAAEGGGRAAAVTQDGLPTHALPYDELYALFGDQLLPYLPSSHPD